LEAEIAETLQKSGNYAFCIGLYFTSTMLPVNIKTDGRTGRRDSNYCQL